MIIKYTAPHQPIRQKIPSLVVLIGQDYYLQGDAAKTIQSEWDKAAPGECETRIMHLESPADWEQLIEVTTCYSLFSERTFIDGRCEKKTLDEATKKRLTSYLSNPNPRCLILLKLPHCGVKQMAWLSNNPLALIVSMQPLNANTALTWISTELRNRGIQHDPSVARMIQQCTTGNTLASMQAIERIELGIEPGAFLTMDLAKEQLCTETNYQLYELADACLLSHGDKVISILRQLEQSGTEITLILWLISQEIRQLLALSHQIHQKISLRTACAQLKIWAQRINLYDCALKRIPLNKLVQALRECQNLDIQIKTNQHSPIFLLIEHMVVNCFL
jgi:DNA polymerase-3 subunit delta